MFLSFIINKTHRRSTQSMWHFSSKLQPNKHPTCTSCTMTQVIPSYTIFCIDAHHTCRLKFEIEWWGKKGGDAWRCLPSASFCLQARRRWRWRYSVTSSSWHFRWQWRHCRSSWRWVWRSSSSLLSATQRLTSDVYRLTRSTSQPKKG